MSSARAALEKLAELLTASGGQGWLVGGALRDRLLGRETLDHDVAVDIDAAPLAKALAKAGDANCFQLSDEFGAWRLKHRSGAWQIDITPLTGSSIDADLRNRDLTINAIAETLVTADLAQIVDPTGGRADLENRVLRAAGPASFESDPLRVVRLARFTAELSSAGFSVDPATRELARAAAPKLVQTAGERVFQEFRQLICSAHPRVGIEELRASGALEVLLPELDALRGVEQSDYHHLDVYGHTLLALDLAVEIESDPGRFFPGQATALSEYLSRPLANEMTRGQALRFAALLHDIAKPQTRDVTAEGRITFFHHDRQGAQLSSQILQRLKASERLAGFVSALTRDHLRLGFLVHQRPLSPRATYDYLNSTSPVAVDVTLLSVADRFATLGRNHEKAGVAHLELAREMLPQALSWDSEPPAAPIRGDELAERLQIKPGPILGKLLAELTAAAYCAEVSDADGAVAYARRRLDEAAAEPGR